MIPYTKPITTTDQQLDLLVAKGLIINDRNAARQVLRSVGYYRLKGFMLSFRDLAKSDKPFRPGITFEDVFGALETDFQIRSVLFAGIQRLEPMMRATVTTELGSAHGAAWYNDSGLFKDTVRHANTLNKWRAGFEKQSHELYVKHFLNKYGPHQDPPSWMLLETATIGSLSHAYSNLVFSTAKEGVAHCFGLRSANTCANWFHTMSHLRNVICHHGRIWYASFSITPRLPGQLLKKSSGSPMKNHYRLAAQVYVLYSLLKAVDLAAATVWMGTFKSAVVHLPPSDLEHNGFESDWNSHPIFN